MKFNNIIPTIKYAILTIKHKYFVFVAGLYVGVPLITLLKHDLSKFYICELPNYGRQFFGDKSDPEKFDVAWLHHQNSNKHHWEYWIPRTGHNKSNGNPVPLDMPEIYVKEMIADWLGAGRAYNKYWPDVRNWTWLSSNIDKMILSENTKKLINKTVDYLIVKGYFC